MTKLISIEGMSCAHCKMRVENTLKALDGVTTASVQLDKKQATVTLSEDVAASVFEEAIGDIGFGVISVEDAPAKG